MAFKYGSRSSMLFAFFLGVLAAIGGSKWKGETMVCIRRLMKVICLVGAVGLQSGCQSDLDCNAVKDASDTVSAIVFPYLWWTPVSLGDVTKPVCRGFRVESRAVAAGPTADLRD